MRVMLQRDHLTPHPYPLLPTQGSGGNHGGHSSQSLDEDKIGKEDFSEEKGGTQGVCIEKGNEGTDKGNEGTDKQDGGTDNTKVSTDRQGEGTADQNEGKSVTQRPTSTPTPITPTPIVFGDDETIAQVLIIIDQYKEKLTGKGKRTEKKFKQLANDEEVAKKVQEEWEAEEEKKRLAEEKKLQRLHSLINMIHQAKT
ncbi:hypothetical protein Tco_0001220 [Tanacetum coccineum]